MVLELTLLILVWLEGLTAVHRVVPAPPRRPQRAQRPAVAAAVRASARALSVTPRRRAP
jgi:hypothetical protein